MQGALEAFLQTLAHVMTVWHRRAEATLVVEQLAEFKSKMKLCAIESRILANTETRILLTKVDAVLREAQQVGIDMQSQIQGLHMGNQELLSQMSTMVPVSQLHTSQAEASKLREDVTGLNQQLQRALVEIDDLKCSMQVCVSAELYFMW
jgi:hypothetical protein